MTTITAAALTSRERVNRAMERRDQDRIPRHETFWWETVTRWQGEGLQGGYEAALERLGTDMTELVWYWPQPFPGQYQVLEETAETQVVRDENGGILRRWKNKSGTPEHLGWSCKTPDDWRQHVKPGFDAQGVQFDFNTAQPNFAKAQATSRWSYIAGVEPFECIRKIIGDEQFMISVMEDPDWIAEMAQVVADVALRNYEAALAAGIRPDGIWTYGDMAFRNGTFCSPKAYKTLIWPQHKRLCDWAHAHGMKFIYHTDGDVNRVIDLYLEAGFDCLQPLECKAKMDIRTLVPKFGRQLAFFGNIDIMIMITNDIDQIEAEMRAKFAAGMSTKGYLYHSDHSVPPQVSWATYQKIIALVDQLGRYG